MMSKFSNQISSFFLNKVDSSDFITYKKGQFIMVMNLVFLLLMTVFSFVSIALPPERAKSVLTLTSIASVMTILVLAVLKSGRVQLSLNAFSVITTILSIGGFVTKPPHIAGVSLGYFMMMVVAYTSLFCSIKLTTSVLISFIITHAGYYYIKALPSAEGLIIDTVKTTLIDGIITLAGTYAIGVTANAILNRALTLTVDESNKNREQYKKISSMNTIMKQAMAKITGSIHVTSGVVDSLSGSFQSQAASFEELAASMEEISASTTSVTFASREQNEAVTELFRSFGVLSESVDLLEEYGNGISEIFASLLKQTREGENTTARLDATNKKISGNSGEIQSVVTVMEDFFDKINLLSLNATIEAARAGEYGMGFAVVAGEIGKLAENSSRDLKLISGLVEKNREDVEEGNRNISEIISFINSLLQSISSLQKQSAQALDQMKKQKGLKEEMNLKAGSVKRKSEQIERSMNEQESAIADIVISIENFNSMLQSNTESTYSLKDSTRELSDMADKMNMSIE